MKNSTLYEAMQYIDNYLYERSGALNKITDTRMNKVNELDKNIATIRQSGAADSRDKIKEMNDQKFKLAGGKIGNSPYSNLNASYSQQHEKNATDARTHGSVNSDAEYQRKIAKQAIGQGKQNIPQQRQPGYYLNKQQEKSGTKLESVDTIIRIYEAYNNGIITESDKNEYLSILDSFTEKPKISERDKDDLKFMGKYGVATAGFGASAAFLAKRVKDTTAVIKRLEKEISEEESKKNPDKDKIKDLKNALKKRKADRRLYMVGTGAGVAGSGLSSALTKAAYDDYNSEIR